MTADVFETAGDPTAGIQPHGWLVVLRGEDRVVCQASANAARFIGREPVPGTPFLELVEPAARAAVEASLRDAWQAEPDPFRIPMAGAVPETFDAIAHGLSGDVIVVEMERDPAPSRSVSPSPGSDSAGRLVRRSLAAASGLGRPGEIAAVIAREMQRFTGFERVLVVRLAEDFHGEVVAEECAADMDPFLGLRVPGTAWLLEEREDYRAGRARYIYDVAARPVPLGPSLYPRMGAPPDLLSRAVLRGPSPAMVRHLASLDVASSLTVPLVVEDRLWGLILCHNRRPEYLDPRRRAAACLCALVMAAQIGLKQQAMEDRHHAVHLEHTNENLRRFAGVVAHEVKGQIQPGIMALSMLRSACGDSPEPDFAPLARMAEESLSRLAAFTSEMLAFAEAEMSALLEDIDLQVVVDQVMRQIRLDGTGHGVRFEVSELPRIRGLRVQMHHVMANLLKNALLHGRDGGRPLHIRVGSAIDPEHGPVVFVSDDGRGIAVEDQQRMFDYFARGRSGGAPGSGIGLAFCAQVIQRQGHRLWVDSSPGKGAAFYFTVSLAEDAPAPS